MQHCCQLYLKYPLHTHVHESDLPHDQWCSSIIFNSKNSYAQSWQIKTLTNANIWNWENHDSSHSPMDNNKWSESSFNLFFSLASPAIQFLKWPPLWVKDQHSWYKIWCTFWKCKVQRGCQLYLKYPLHTHVRENDLPHDQWCCTNIHFLQLQKPIRPGLTDEIPYLTLIFKTGKIMILCTVPWTTIHDQNVVSIYCFH